MHPFNPGVLYCRQNWLCCGWTFIYSFWCSSGLEYNSCFCSVPCVRSVSEWDFGLGSYLMLIFLAPYSVLTSLEAMRAKFFWGVDMNERHMHWVRWDIVLVTRVEGGLGCRELVLLQQVMMFRWWDRDVISMVLMVVIGLWSLWEFGRLHGMGLFVYSPNFGIKVSIFGPNVLSGLVMGVICLFGRMCGWGRHHLLPLFIECLIWILVDMW